MQIKKKKHGHQYSVSLAAIDWTVESVVANVKYLLLSITWKVSNQARFVGKLAGVLRNHDSNLEEKKRE